MINLVGDNEDSVGNIISKRSFTALNLRKFYNHFDSYCEKIPDLHDKSDDYYYETHPDLDMTGLSINN